MTTFIIGSSKLAFTAGICACDEAGEGMPFMAFAPTDVVERELKPSESVMSLKGEEDVMKLRDIFDKHGTVIFFDNYLSFDNMMTMLASCVERAAMSEWINRMPKREAVQ
jgi:hypothetical protein